MLFRSTLDACELTYMQPCAFLRRSGLEGWRRGGGGGEGGPYRPRAVPGAYIEHLRSGQRNPGRLLVTIWCSLPVADIVYIYDDGPGTLTDPNSQLLVSISTLLKYDICIRVYVAESLEWALEDLDPFFRFIRE